MVQAACSLPLRKRTSKPKLADSRDNRDPPVGTEGESTWALGVSSVG